MCQCGLKQKERLSSFGFGLGDKQFKLKLVGKIQRDEADA
jgi:hypothetical protein